LSEALEELALGIASADRWQLEHDGVEDYRGVAVVFVGELSKRLRMARSLMV
jgi:hypothetical protein